MYTQLARPNLCNKYSAGVINIPQHLEQRHTNTMEVNVAGIIMTQSWTEATDAINKYCEQRHHMVQNDNHTTLTMDK